MQDYHINDLGIVEDLRIDLLECAEYLLINHIHYFNTRCNPGESYTLTKTVITIAVDSPKSAHSLILKQYVWSAPEPKEEILKQYWMYFQNKFQKKNNKNLRNKAY